MAPLSGGTGGQVLMNVMYGGEDDNLNVFNDSWVNEAPPRRCVLPSKVTRVQNNMCNVGGFNVVRRLLQRIW